MLDFFTWVFCGGGFFNIFGVFDPVLCYKHRFPYPFMSACPGRNHGVFVGFMAAVPTGIFPKAGTQARQTPQSPWTQTRTLQNFHLGLPQHRGCPATPSTEQAAKLVPLVGWGGLELAAGIHVPNQFRGRSPCASPGCHNHHVLCGHSKYL